MKKLINVEVAGNGIILTISSANIMPGSVTERLVYSDEDGVKKIIELIAEERVNV
jgi:hypothetical protein